MQVSEQDAKKPESIWQSWKAKAKHYGPFFVVYYTGVWICTGIGTYFIIDHTGPEFAVDMMKTAGLDQYIDLSSFDPKVGNLAVAVATMNLSSLSGCLLVC